MANVTSKDIEEALRKVLGSFGLDHVELKPGVDHDGEAALFVTAVLKPNTRLMPGEVSTSANVAVTQAMEKVGDERLSYLYIRRPDDQRPEEEKSRASSS
jgi:hypothetical protein